MLFGLLARLTPTARSGLVGVFLILVIVAAYHAGQWKEAADQRAAAAEARIEHINAARETENEIESLDDGAFGTALDGRLSGRND